jgi:hypothetical protein
VDIARSQASDGALIAAVSAAVNASQADPFDAVGEELKKAVATIGPRYNVATLDQP